MAFAEDTTVFFNTDGIAVSVLLTKAGGSPTATTSGITEDSVTGEDTTFRASRPSFLPQITVPASVAGPYGEGDTAEFIPSGESSAVTFTIIDVLTDGIQTTFSLNE